MLKHTKIDFDFNLFLAEYNRIKDSEVNYARGGKDAPYWKVIRDNNLNSEISRSYAQFIKDSYGIVGKINVSFYRLLANETLPWHIDTDTKCSINFILNGDAAPVSYKDGSYTYKQALIRTDIPHMVKNGNKDRILYKISIFDMDFEDVAALLP
jgi:hypothetical protein